MKNKSCKSKLKAAGSYIYREGTVYMILIVLVIFFSIFNPLFLSSRNLYNMLTQSTYVIIAGMGICFVMISGGIDLSVGYLMSVCSCTAAIMMLDHGLPVWTVWPVCIVVGALMGTLNGFLSAKLKLFPLVITIGTTEVFKGIAYTMTSSRTFSGMPDSFRALYKTKFLGLPLDV
ncbi:MAG: ABC transporter permease, partial [Lachnospiraceae bacterium]